MWRSDSKETVMAFQIARLLSQTLMVEVQGQKN